MVPQTSVPLTVPHSAPRLLQNSACGRGTQPHWLAVFDPQTSNPEQVPQFTVRALPQLSVPEYSPQVSPSRSHSCWSVSGRQPH